MRYGWALAASSIALGAVSACSGSPVPIHVTTPASAPDASRADAAQCVSFATAQLLAHPLPSGDDTFALPPGPGAALGSLVASCLSGQGYVCDVSVCSKGGHTVDVRELIG